MNKFFLFLLFLSVNLSAQVSNNKVFAWGDNSLAQLGDGTLVTKNTPSQLGTSTNWQQVKAGLRHSAAIKNDGSLWTWGDNYYGELGIGSYWFADGTPRYRANPVRVGLDNDWKQVDAGGVFTIALKNDGSLWGWGNNYEGQLGIGSTTGNTPYGWTFPQKIGSSSDWKKISVGDKHVIAIKNDGTLWAWGDNYFGQLGDGTGIDKLVPTQIGSDNDWKEIAAGSVNTLALKNNGTLWSFGSYTFWIFNTPTQLGTDTDWKVISNGAFGRTAIPEGMAIKEDGSLWVMKFTGASAAGFNPQKEASSNDWSQVSVGYYHAAAIKKDNTLWTWGRNVEGQLGDGTYVNQANPIQVGTSNKWVQVSLGEMFTTAVEYDCTVPNAPSVSDITYCQNVTATPLTATGTNLLWYSTAIGGTGSTTAPTPSTATAGIFSYFVSQSDGSCESPRAEIKVTINALLTVSIINLNESYLQNAPTVTLTGLPNGGSFKIDGNAATVLDPSVLSVGSHSVVYNFSDANGCSNFVSKIVVINPAPTGELSFNCPTDISITAAVGQTTAVVNYIAPTASSTCPIGTVKVTADVANPASGTVCPIGTKTLSFTATDGCGNTKMCSFTITVIANTNPCIGDITKPTAKCKRITVYLDQYGKATISGSDINDSSTDNCSTPLSFGVIPNTFDCSKIGANTVTLTATDAAGNKSSCTSTVIVSDNSQPVFKICPSNTTLSTTGNCVNYTWVKPTATDNCCTPSVSSNYSSGACFPIGTTSVIYTATDLKGNKATCSFSITVTALNTCLTSFDANKCYKIVNKKSGKLLDVYGGQTTNNTPLIQWYSNNGTNQKWRFTSVGSGYVKIVAQHSGKVAACHQTSSNSLVYQYDYAPGGAKDWKIECVNNSGYYKITHRLSGKVLDVKNGSSTDGQNIVISNFNANNNSQLWQIVEVTCPTQTYNLASSTIFDINGQAEFDRNRIGFTTNQGFRTDFFTIEKQEKVSGQFEPLEILNNKQVDNNAQYNTVYDNSPYQGDNFYRVKMTYLSGDFDYSAIQKIVNTQKADFVIFPNPASNEAWIDLKSFEGRTIDILMSDVAGKVLRYEKIDKATVAPYRLDLTDIQSGSYLLTIQTKGKRTVVGKLSILK